MQDIKLKPSFSHQLIWAILVVTTLLILLPLTLAGWEKMLLALLVTIYSIWVWWRYLSLHSQYAIHSLRCDNSGQWRLRQKDGDEILALLDGMSIKTRFFCLLRFRLIDAEEKYKGKRVCIISPDTVTAGEYRRLLMWASVA